MIHLLPDTAQQFAYFSPFQARKFLASFTNYLVVFVNQATQASAACILNVVADNARYTQVGIGTAETDPEGGNVLITESGLYTYTIYGQNSETNTDPNDVAVVGVCETGTCRIAAANAWQTENITIPDNVIYYE